MDPRISIITLGVTDLDRSLRFYRDGLGFPTTRKADAGIIFFQTSGVCLALYPYTALAKDVSDEFLVAKSRFTGITLAHNVRSKEEVDRILKQAKQAGATIEKTGTGYRLGRIQRVLLRPGRVPLGDRLGRI